MTPTIDEILAAERKTHRGHARRYIVYFLLQVLALGVGAIASSINAFAQSLAAQGTVYSNPDLLFWTGILSALAALVAGLGLTAEVAKQKARRDFHRLMVGKIERKTITDAEEAQRLIDEYFGTWRP